MDGDADVCAPILARSCDGRIDGGIRIALRKHVTQHEIEPICDFLLNVRCEGCKAPDTLLGWPDKVAFKFAFIEPGIPFKGDLAHLLAWAFIHDEDHAFALHFPFHASLQKTLGEIVPTHKESEIIGQGWGSFGIAGEVHLLCDHLIHG